MHKYIICVILLTSNLCFSQEQWFYKHVLNQELRLSTHIDSFTNIFPITDGWTIIENDTINVKTNYKDYYTSFREFYQGYVKPYYLLKEENDSLAIVLHFCFDHLFQISLHAKGRDNLNKIRRALLRLFKLKFQMEGSSRSDSTNGQGQIIEERRIYGKNKKFLIYYVENIINQTGYMTLEDRKIMKRMPHWCGTCDMKKNTWTKLEKYIRNTR